MSQSNPYESPQTDDVRPSATIFGHPVGLASLFFTEMWERFSYYGMRALLVLYMTHEIAASEAGNGGMGLDEKTATAIYGLYTAFVYLVALPGGFIADRLLGAQRSVLIGGCIIALGHFTLAIPRDEAFYAGLILIVSGTGLLKPNISVIVGQLYPEGGARRDAGFTIFYMGINLGAALGPLVCSTLGEKYNWHYGFAAAGVGMVAGLAVYVLTSRFLGDAGRHRTHTNESEGFNPAWLVLIGGGMVTLICLAMAVTRTSLLDPIKLNTYATYLTLGVGGVYLLGIAVLGRLKPREWKRMIVLVVLLVASAMFWSGFEQAGSSLNLFASEYTQRELAGFVIPAGWFQSLNPVFIIVLAPVVASVWTALAHRGRDLSIPAKFALGLILLGLGFLIMAGASSLVGPNKRVLPTWLIGTYFIHTIGELCLSPVGLSAVTKLSPKRFVSQMMGMWFLASALGLLIAGLLAGEIAEDVTKMPRGYLQIVATSIGSGVILLLLSWPLQRLIGSDKEKELEDESDKPTMEGPA